VDSAGSITPQSTSRWVLCHITYESTAQHSWWCSLICELITSFWLTLAGWFAWQQATFVLGVHTEQNLRRLCSSGHNHAGTQWGKQVKHAASTSSCCVHRSVFVPEIRMRFASSALGWIRFSFNPCWQGQTSCCVLCSQFSRPSVLSVKQQFCFFFFHHRCLVSVRFFWFAVRYSPHDIVSALLPFHNVEQLALLALRADQPAASSRSYKRTTSNCYKRTFWFVVGA
jgi:hypothetical protein